MSTGTEVGGAACAFSKVDARRARAARRSFFIALKVTDEGLMSKQKGATC